MDDLLMALFGQTEEEPTDPKERERQRVDALALRSLMTRCTCNVHVYANRKWVRILARMIRNKSFPINYSRHPNMAIVIDDEVPDGYFRIRHDPDDFSFREFNLHPEPETPNALNEMFDETLQFRREYPSAIITEEELKALRNDHRS